MVKTGVAALLARQCRRRRGHQSTFDELFGPKTARADLAAVLAVLDNDRLFVNQARSRSPPSSCSAEYSAHV